MKGVPLLLEVRWHLCADPHFAQGGRRPSFSRGMSLLHEEVQRREREEQERKDKESDKGGEQ